MDEKIRAKELQEDFENEFNKTLGVLCETYPRISRVKKEPTLTEDTFKMVIYTVLINTLMDLQTNSMKLTMKEFHKKYVSNLPILYRCDFTCDEYKKIIDDSYLKARDKSIAYKFFVERKNSNDIYAELKEIGDKKTIDNNLKTIKEALLYRACIFNKEN